MRGSSREGNIRIVFVHDAAGLFAGAPLNILGKHYTTPKVIEEVRDVHSKLLLEYALHSGKLEVLEPQTKYVKIAEDKAREIGEIIVLSDTDISVIALALELRDKGYKVVVVTDDYAVQNTTLHLNLEFMSIKTTGIKEMMKYQAYCPTCHWKGLTSLKSCPRCGSTLKRRPVKP